MKPAIIVQARMDSERLPGKVLLDIQGKPMIQHVMDRCREVMERVILTTTDRPEDAPLRDFARAQGWMVYAPLGVPPENVGQRYYWTGLAADADPIIRVTGDCPLMDPNLIRWALEQYDGCIFTATTPTSKTGFPDGQDIEIIPRSRLAACVGHEHVTTELHEGLVRYLRAKDYNMTWPEGKWSVDTLEDLGRVRDYLKKVV